MTRCLSNAASFAVCVFRRVTDPQNLLHFLSLLKATCVRQVPSGRQVLPPDGNLRTSDVHLCVRSCVLTKTCCLPV